MAAPFLHLIFFMENYFQWQKLKILQGLKATS